MLNLPERTIYKKRIPKNKFYNKINADSKLESMFREEVDYIIWKHKLSEETTNLDSTEEVQEIQVFEVFLKTGELSREVLENIDRVIPYPILYILRYRDKVKLSMAYKERNKTDENKMVIKSYYETKWMKEYELDFNIISGLTLKDVYDNILRQLIPIQSSIEEDIEDVIELNEKIEKLKREIEILEKKINREKQFNKKVEINRKVRKKIKELDGLLDR